MKLRNKKTGEIVIASVTRVVSGVDFDCGQTLAELNEEWEDCEESKDFWFVDAGGEVRETNYLSNNDKSGLRSFGNYYSSREEAEKAVGRLRAWKRLKDRGFRFTGYTSKDRGTITEFEIYCDTGKPCIDRDEFTDLDLLFSGGEE